MIDNDQQTCGGSAVVLEMLITMVDQQTNHVRSILNHHGYYWLLLFISSNSLVKLINSLITMVNHHIKPPSVQAETAEVTTAGSPIAVTAVRSVVAQVRDAEEVHEPTEAQEVPETSRHGDSLCDDVSREGISVLMFKGVSMVYLSMVINGCLSMVINGEYIY